MPSRIRGRTQLRRDEHPHLSSHPALGAFYRHFSRPRLPGEGKPTVFAAMAGTQACSQRYGGVTLTIASYPDSLKEGPR
jgi:hypothetical protein